MDRLLLPEYTKKMIDDASNAKPQKKNLDLKQNKTPLASQYWKKILAGKNRMWSTVSTAVQKETRQKGLLSIISRCR
ncbi:hypothetical protein TNCT_100121 [Trichonephila clavata]|uniref:Uncharacterized protein n=1 Tax=Trichonephila clavata TaxID=2740835 RepID=A0A8X6L0J7_TRICU|nr:hypothetical protein TNCT_100121 [Trichonephila clavata]